MVEEATITDQIAPNAVYTHNFETEFVLNEPGKNIIEGGLNGSDDVPADDIVRDSINIVSSPSGFAFSEGPAFPGYFRDILGGGTTVNPDATAPDSMMQYELQTPARYSNSDYGTTWEGTAGARTMGGQPVTVSMSRNPSSSGNGLLQFTAPKSLEDSMVYISYTIRDNSTMCDSTIGRWVYVVPTPTASFVANNVCDGTPVEYRSTSAMSKADVVLLYEWDFNDPNSTEDVSEIAEGVYTYETFGTYDIEMIVRHSEYPKFEFKAMKSITVTPVPTVDYKVISACYGEDVTFTNNTSSPVPATITYRWDFGDGTSSTMEEPSKGYSQAGQYQVTLTATANGCSRSVTKNANQFAVPTADFSWEGECVSQPISLMGNNSIAIGNAGYEWVFDNGERRTNEEESFTWSTPGQKTVKLRAISEFNCQDSVEKQITIVDAPVADFEFSDPCNLSDINFTFTGKTVGVPLYSWDFNGESTSDAANPSVRFDEGEKMVKLRLETSQNNCVSEIEKSFRVKLQPEADFAVEDVCEGDEAVFTNMSSVARGEMNFNWKFGTGDQDNSTNPRYAYITNGETETYNVTLVASVTGGCSDSVSKTITVNELPNVNFTVDRRGRTVGLTPSGNTSNYTFKRWTFGDGGSSSEDAPVYTYDNIINGEFEICFSAQSNAGCLNSTCETVIIDVLSTEEMEVSWLKVYPNPSSGQLTLEVEGNQRDLEISVLNQLGEEVYTYQPNVLNGRYAMDLSELASGMYLIRVNNDDASAIRKIQIVK
jgi:PKD repeat protein